MQDIARLHDQMLEQEMPLLELAEELGGIRCRMFTLRDPGLMHKAAKVAEELSDAAREYQEWLQGCWRRLTRNPGKNPEKSAQTYKKNTIRKMGTINAGYIPYFPWNRIGPFLRLIKKNNIKESRRKFS